MIDVRLPIEQPGLSLTTGTTLQLKDDAFDPFLEGVHGIVHTATPVTFALEDPEEYIRPAVDGTMGILKTAAKHKCASLTRN